MKLLQINAFSFKSTGHIMMNIHNIAQDNGFDSYVAWSRGREASSEKEIKFGSSLDVNIHGILTRITDKTGFYSSGSTKKLLNKIDAIQPDIIHLHNIHGYYINIELLFNYIRDKNIKVVWTLHDCWAFTGHCAHFDYVGCNKWKTGCHHCPQKKTYPASYFVDNSKWNFQRKKELFTSIKDMVIVTPSEWLAGLVRESYLSSYPVHVIPNGIDLEIFKPRESDFRSKYGLEDKKIVLGVASEWSERKGLNDFIKLSTMLDVNMRIVLVGLNANQLKALPSNIIGISRTHDAIELAEIYTAADVFVNPTYEDNFPTVNLEALACGTPVITYNTGGSPESIDESCGWVVDKGDLNKVTALISEYDHSFNTHDCVKRGLMYDKKNRFDEYMKLYTTKV